MSDEPTVVQALAAVMAEVQPIGKTDRNEDQGYLFRGIDAVVNVVGPILRKHNVIVLPVLQKASYRDVQTSRGKPSRESTVEVLYRFHGPAGDFIEAVVPGEAMDFGDKGVAKAMSVAFRIVLLQALAIPTGEPDPDSQTYEREQDTGSPMAIELFADIVNAKSEAELKVVWEALVAAREDGKINQREAAQLNSHVKRRKQELERDSTSDSDGGGTEPGAAGEGVGPDGSADGDSGPGRDGEAGGVRPGVQPGVHSRAGIGGPAQAPRDNRNTPAPAGGRRG